MRVWDIHPGYLTRGNLLGQHAEIHALYTVLTGQGSGYRQHPETLRWQGRLQQLPRRHDNTVAEMKLRGYNHNSPLPPTEAEPLRGQLSYVDGPTVQMGLLDEKNRTRGVEGRITLPRRGSELWAQHKYSVMARGYNHYKEIQQFMGNRKDLPIAQEEDLLACILSKMDLPVVAGALKNTLDHLWGYFKHRATPEEQQRYKSRCDGENGETIVWLYSLAVKYHESYLLQSTIFGDVIAE